jgi:hypothetical protein
MRLRGVTVVCNSPVSTATVAAIPPDRCRWLETESDLPRRPRRAANGSVLGSEPEISASQELAGLVELSVYFSAARQTTMVRGFLGNTWVTLWPRLFETSRNAADPLLPLAFPAVTPFTRVHDRPLNNGEN